MRSCPKKVKVKKNEKEPYFTWGGVAERCREREVKGEERVKTAESECGQGTKEEP